jgi:hypothetical protein
MRSVLRWIGLSLIGLFVLKVATRKRPESAPLRSGPSLSDTVIGSSAQWLDRRFGWHRMPPWVGLYALVGLRKTLRRLNLHDTSTTPTIPSPPPVRSNRYLTERSPDGTFNDLDDPRMGSAGTRFGRNAPIAQTYPEVDAGILSPSPRTVSRELLTREEFIPATTLNLLAGAWLQFMIRDWFSHGKGPKERPWEIPLSADDPWPERPMTILRTPPDPTRPPGVDGQPPTYINTETHWWDASQLYGNNTQMQSVFRTRSEGKLQSMDVLLPQVDPLPPEHPANVPGFWLGLALFHQLFILEHNAICDRLRADYPAWSDDELFEHARLINAALIAKIHTVEWTTAILGHPALQIAMRANWWGLAGESVHRLLGRVSSSEVISGIPGSRVNHFNVPYSITEEFVAVYRMHPLIPDEVSFRAAQDDHELQTRTFPDIAGPATLTALDEMSLQDILYSFGTVHPGSITLHNYPRALQQFQRPDGILQDLAATDILRSRELGVPRYNDFRRMLRLKPASTFEEMTDNPVWAEEMRRVYNGDVERVDLTVGLFAEPLPKGFGFSDTAFRIFILMASRRLNSDRFFTTDYNADVYTQQGMDWIDRNDLSTVLLRHYPALAPALRGVQNGFAPWTRAVA